MILKRKYEDRLFCKNEYFCELTEELDILSGLNKRESYRYDISIMYMQLILTRKNIVMLLEFLVEH